MKILLPLALACATVGAAHADICFKDYKAKDIFGSAEQLTAIQKLAGSKCTIVGLTFQFVAPVQRSTLIIADLENGEMIRLKIDPMGSRPWEAWRGFTRDQLLSAEPSGVINLGQFVSSKTGEKPTLSSRVEQFIKAQRMERFL